MELGDLVSEQTSPIVLCGLIYVPHKKICQSSKFQYLRMRSFFENRVCKEVIKFNDVIRVAVI